MFYLSFLSLIFKNPFRSKSRALIVIVSIAIGIACIVALGSITNGLTNDVDELLHTGGSDFVVSGKTSKSIDSNMFGTDNIDDSWVNTIGSYPGVNKVVGTYIVSITSNDGFQYGLIGMDNDCLDIANVNLSSGKIYSTGKNEIILGELLANDTNKSVGDSFRLGDKIFNVVGIYSSGDSNIDLCAFTSLETARKFDNVDNKVSMIYVKVNSGVDVAKITDGIDKKYNKSITTIKSFNDLESINNSMNLLNMSSWAISLLAIIIGSIGVINTMLMTVHERTKELGLLKAIGWSNKRILLMILGESVVTTIFGAILGFVIGVVGVELLVMTNSISIAPAFVPDIFIQGFIVAIVVGIVGGLYPAVRAVRLTPTKALGFE